MPMHPMKNGKIHRYNKAVIDCSNDTILTEQSHVKDADINNIIKKHGVDMIQRTAALQHSDYQFDDIAGNDFQEAMQKITRAQQEFDKLPHEIRAEFDNSPAKFLDFVQNPENTDRMVTLGLATRPEQPPAAKPMEVVVVSPETPPTTPSETPAG